MNEQFGAISSDRLPSGFGQSETRVVQKVSESHPVAPTESENYRGLFDSGFLSNIFKKKDDEPASSTAVPEAPPEDPERAAFWKNLFGGLKPKAIIVPGYRDLPGSQARRDSYDYRQFSDGSVQVTAGPQAIGSKFPPGSVAANNVVTMYGPFIPSSGSTTTASRQTSGRGAEIGAGVGAAASQIIPALAQLLGGRAAPQMELAPVSVPSTSYQKSEVPWGMIIGGIVLVGGIAFIVARSGGEEEE